MWCVYWWALCYILLLSQFVHFVTTPLRMIWEADLRGTIKQTESWENVHNAGINYLVSSSAKRFNQLKSSSERSCSVRFVWIDKTANNTGDWLHSDQHLLQGKADYNISNSARISFEMLLQRKSITLIRSLLSQAWVSDPPGKVQKQVDMFWIYIYWFGS